MRRIPYVYQQALRFIGCCVLGGGLLGALLAVRRG